MSAPWCFEQSGAEDAARDRVRGMPLVRHLTATGFVVHDDQVALHWHPKVQAWLPPGGHIDEN